MAPVSLDHIHHYQPLPSTVRSPERRPVSQTRSLSVVSKMRDNSTALAPRTNSRVLQDYDPIEYVDLTTSLPVEPYDPAGDGSALRSFRSQPKPVFRTPPSWRDLQPRENVTSLSRSTGGGGSADDPFRIDEAGKKTGESRASTGVRSVESEIGSTLPSSSPTVEEPRAISTLEAPTILEAPVGPVDPPTSPDLPPPPYTDKQVTLDLLAVEPASEPVEFPPGRSTPTPPERDARSDFGEDDRAAAIASPPSASLSSLSPSRPTQTAPLKAEEWEVKKILDKRLKGRRYEYRVRWTDTWMSKRELGSARRLLRKFEARHQAYKRVK